MTTPSIDHESLNLESLRAPESCDVAVIGGGISGLVAGHRLAAAGAKVKVLEADDRIGGVIRSETRDDGLMELGPFSVMVRSPEFQQLLDDLDLVPTTIDAGRARRRYIQLGGKLRLLPGSVLGLLLSNLLSLRGRIDLLKSALSDRMPGRECGSTLHDFGVRRFGKEFADHIVGPGTIGIFGAEAWELETEACLPAFHREDGLARTTLGLIRGLQRNAPPGPPRRLMSLDGGLSSLIERLASRMDDAVITGARVKRILRVGSGFQISQAEGRPLRASSVVLAVGPETTARLTAEIAPRVCELVRDIRVAGLGVVHLVFDDRQVGRALDGFGYLVPATERDMDPVLGVIWPGSVFPEHRVPGKTVIRVMVGGTRWPLALSLDDRMLVQQCLDRVRAIHRIQGEPQNAKVTRWHASVPVYGPGHADRIREIEESFSGIPELKLAGSWICPPRGGVGVNDRVRHAHEVAGELLEHLNSRKTSFAPTSVSPEDRDVMSRKDSA